MARQITIEHNGTTYFGEVMKAESTHIGVEDHGILTAYVHCKSDHGEIGIGGYGLDESIHDEAGKFVGRRPTAFGFDHIIQIARTIGVARWEDIPGKDLIILFRQAGSWGQTAVGLAHIRDEKKIMIFSEHRDEWAARGAFPADEASA